MLRLLSLAFLTLLATCQGPLYGTERPNIIVFLADDMGLGDIRAYDSTSTIPTPNMDRLAEEGMRFTDVHTPASVCTPTRYGILTGRYPFRTRSYPGVLRSAYDQPLLESRHETVAGLLRRAGYRTAAFGKWHVGMSWTNRAGTGIAQPAVGTSQFSTTDVDFASPIRDGPLQHGFDYFYGIGSTINHGPYTFINGDRVAEIPIRLRPQLDLPGGLYREGWVAASWRDDQQGPVLAERLLDFLREHRRTRVGQPFFVYFAATANHFPNVPPETLRGKRVRGQGGNDDDEPLRNDMIVENDVILGELLAWLEDPNGDGDTSDSIAANTLLLLTSDNGADKGYYAPIRDKKASIYEGGHRVPFIARWPGRVPVGAVNSAAFSLVDLYASFAAMTGTAPAAGSAEDSHNILPALLAAQPKLPVRPAMLQQTAGGADVFAVREGPWKLIIEKGQPRELYNLQQDLKESRNVLAGEAAVAGRLIAEYKRIRGEQTPPSR